MSRELDCNTCEHKNDSGTEHCGSCESSRSNYREAGWHIEKRLKAELAKTEAENKRQAERIKGLEDALRRAVAKLEWPIYTENEKKVMKPTIEQAKAALAKGEKE